MTGSNIKSFFELVVHDSLDSVETYQLMNMARVNIEDDRAWEYRKCLDETIAHLSSDTYLTSHNLPSDFDSILMVYDGTITTPLVEVPFADRNKYQNSANRFFIDYSTNKIYFTGSVSSDQTVHLWYIKNSADISSGTSPVFPVKYHPLIAFKMAEMYYPVDAGERGRTWDDRWGMFYKKLMDQMIDWDSRIKSNKLNNDNVVENADNAVYW